MIAFVTSIAVGGIFYLADYVDKAYQFQILGNNPFTEGLLLSIISLSLAKAISDLWSELRFSWWNYFRKWRN